ncbi:AAA family ATPase [Candidatus Woesearchaeota archaeon]|nr:AAA family ATPase [Candidatus Woesearchaeota archaeon]
MTTLIISGTPGTGKSTLAKFLAPKLKFHHLDIHRYYKKISSGYSKKKQCYNIDLKKLEKLIQEKLTQHPNLIVDSHITHHLPKKLVNLCIITKCSDLKELKKRLQKRKYSQKKIEENIQCEIFDVCLAEAKKQKHHILVVDTCQKINQKKLVSKIKKFL